MKLRASDGRDPRELAAMEVGEHLDTPELKPKYVRVLFDVIAPGYDVFTRLFSFGMDRSWKALLVAEGQSRATPNPILLDLACGTGDLGTELGRCSSARLVVGVDVSWRMLTEARLRSRNTGRRLELALCDAVNLCLADSSVDVVSIGYGLRNTSDVVLVLREIARVLKPGGVLLSLDFYRPARAVWRELFLWYMWNAGRLAGWLWHREPATYGYLAPSIRRYLTITEFERELSRAGFSVELRASRLGGAIGIHVARQAPIHE